ncbi:sensor domain-containing diguanylate cyclase [Rhodopseudomonas sp. RCAM05734]|uniref:sensor domain-containing diguanylate cyclase n=1 Tax=Rhodopseudomonas sp. RCAM05734 TaxID=3457549 RepID=UPI0040439A63
MLLKELTGLLHAFEDRLTVRTQIAAAVAALSVILVGLLAIGAAFVSYSNTASQVNIRLASVASTTAERLDRYMAVRQQEVRLFSELETLRTLWQNDPATLRKALNQLQHSFSDFAWIGFARSDGMVAAATGGLLEGVSVAARPWFKAGLSESTIGDVHEAQLLSSLLAQRADGEPYRFVDIAVPVRDSPGDVIGVLGGHLNWDWARSLIANAEDNDGNTDTRIAVTSRSGTVLVGQSPGTVKFSGSRLSDILASRSGAFVETAGATSMLTAFYVGKGHRDYQGLDWIVTASQPASVALAAAVRSAKTILITGAITGLAGVAFAFFIALRISRPIRAITIEADRIGRASGPTMLPRHNGSVEVVQPTRALRSLLRRIGFAEEQTRVAEARATENAMQFKDDISKLRRLADTDFLTDLMNRRAFLAAADDAMAFSLRYRRSMAVLMIDIDHFKQINDRHGHAAGDGAIKHIAGIIVGNIKATDRAARFGGEEFMVLLREVDEGDARIVADRIRRMIEQTAVGEGATRISATVSIGIALLADNDRDVQDIIERADQGLYQAKNDGRNRTVFEPARLTPGSQVA